MIPGRNDDELIRFSIEVEDTAGRSLRVPLEPAVEPYDRYPGTFYLFEVDDDRGPTFGSPTGPMPVYRILMTGRDLTELEDRALQSDVLLPATFIANDRAYHLVGARYRGENSRRATNRGYKIRFHPDEPFLGVDNVNLNAGNNGSFGTTGFREVLAGDLFRRADVPYPMIWSIALHFPGEVSRNFDTRYVHKEAYDERFLSRYFGGSDDGAFYRPRDPSGAASGNLSYRGDDPDDYREIYEKRSHEDEDDFSDIIALCRTFSSQQTPAEEFPAAVDALIDARQWARFFAVMGCLSNTDGGIWSGSGEDYFLYRVPAESSRPDAGKWILLPWDLEEVFGNADERLFRSTVNAIERLYGLPENARLYYEELRRAADGAFSRLQMRQRYDSAGLMFAGEDVFDVVDAIDTNVTVRLGFIDAEASWALRAGAVGTNADNDGEPIIVEGDDWRYFRGTEDPAGGGTAWTEIDYDDGGWSIGASGFGYSDGDDSTILRDMEDGYSTVFTRREFQVVAPGDVVGLELTVDYDDAYVAYLNGTEVARSDSAPVDETIAFDATARDTHEASGGGFGGNDPEVRDLAGNLGLLESGTNVLAIVGINGSIGSSDFSLIPSLSLERRGGEGGGPAGGCGDTLYAQGAFVELAGECNAATSRSVSVNGVAVAVDVIDGGTAPWGGRWRAEVDLAPGENVFVVRGHSRASGEGAVVETKTITVHRSTQRFQTVEGSLSGNTVWRADGGPYHLTGDVTVGGNATLTIEPGVVILLDANASILVRGQLNAVGTVDEPIRMLAFECGQSWGGIAFDRTGRAEDDPVQELRFVRASGGRSAGGFAGCIAATDSKLVVADCELSDIRANAIDTQDAELRVERCFIHDIFEGIHCVSSTAIVLDSRVENMTGNSDAIDFDGSGDERSLIARCVLASSSDDGIDLGNVTVDIQDNVIFGVQDKAISMEGRGSQGSPTITGNLVYASGTGMAIKDGINVVEGGHNTVANCQEGIDLFAKDESNSGGEATFHSTIVWENGLDVILDELSSVAFELSNVSSERFPGPGNISSDPFFVNAPEGNYSLRRQSPSLGTGRDGTNMGAIAGGGIDEDPIFIRGDLDRNGDVNLADVVQMLNYLFRAAGGPSTCLDIVDANDDGGLDVSDPIYALRFLFGGGATIAPPFPDAGTDPTPDDFDCDL